MPDFNADDAIQTQHPIESGYSGGMYAEPTPASVAGNDDVNPTVTVVSPVEGSEITATTPLVVDVEDEQSLAIVLLYAEFPNRTGAEVVHNGTTFMAPYATNSSRVSIEDGFRYTLRRDGGWPGDVSLTAIPVDRGGNTST